MRAFSAQLSNLLGWRVVVPWRCSCGGGSGGGGGSGSAARRAKAASEVLQVALLLCGVYAAGCCGTSRIYRLRYAAAALATAGLFGAAV